MCMHIDTHTHVFTYIKVFPVCSATPRQEVQLLSGATDQNMQLI